MTGGENPFGKTNDFLRIINNIKEGKGDYSKINSKNVFLGEKWLEGLNLIMWMTKKDFNLRPMPKELLNCIFFQTSDQRKAILIKAKDIMHHPDKMVKDMATQYVDQKIVPAIK